MKSYGELQWALKVQLTQHLESLEKRRHEVIASGIVTMMKTIPQLPPTCATRDTKKPARLPVRYGMCSQCPSHWLGCLSICNELVGQTLQ